MFLHRKNAPLCGAILTLFLLGTLMTGCGSSSTVSAAAKPVSTASTSKTGFYFDTVITITIYGTEDEAPLLHCMDLADYYENLLSNTKPASEISQINAKAGTGEYVTVSDDTLEVILDGIHYSEESQGTFDVTLGRLSSLWNISKITEVIDTPDKETTADHIPDAKAITQALETVDYHTIEIDGNQIRLTESDTMLDLGAIAKGFIADKMKESLISDGISSALINLGGNVLCVGSKPDGSDFKIGLQKPFDTENPVLAILPLSDKSVVTSGVYERYFRVDGQIYHHLLDLDTGYPCVNNLYGVTIVSDSSMDGDALSTTCFILGLEEGMKLIESLDQIEAIFITDDMQTHTSSGFASGNYELNPLN